MSNTVLPTSLTCEPGIARPILSMPIPKTREEAHALLNRVREGSTLVPTWMIDMALQLTGDMPGGDEVQDG